MMYESPSGMLSYVFVDQSILYSIIAGLFLVPIWFASWMVLFRLWQEEMWCDYEDWISLVLDHGFQCANRPIGPYWSFSNDSVRVTLIGTPFGTRAYLSRKEGRFRLSTHLDELQLAIDSLVQEGSISMPQNC